MSKIHLHQLQINIVRRLLGLGQLKITLQWGTQLIKRVSRPKRIDSDWIKKTMEIKECTMITLAVMRTSNLKPKRSKKSSFPRLLLTLKGLIQLTKLRQMLVSSILASQLTNRMTRIIYLTMIQENKCQDSKCLATIVTRWDIFRCAFQASLSSKKLFLFVSFAISVDIETQRSKKEEA